MKIYKAGEEIPEGEDFCYIVARDGFYLKKSNHFYGCVVKVKSIPDLPELEESLVLRQGMPKIPYSLVEEAIAFFRAVFNEYNSEAAALLVFDNHEKQWSIRPVKQRVSSASVEYGTGAVSGVCGTIHSHCNMGAFFSCTDDKDDSQTDGFHIVVGNINSDRPDIAASVSVNGARFNCEPGHLIDGLPDPEPKHPWLSFVEKGTLARDKKTIAGTQDMFEGFAREQKGDKEEEKTVTRYELLKVLEQVKSWPEESKGELFDMLIEDSEWARY